MDGGGHDRGKDLSVKGRGVVVIKKKCKEKHC